MFIKLAENKKTEYCIITPKNPEPAVQYAASELACFLKQISGAEFPVADETKAASDFEIVVGLSNRTEKYDKRLAEISGEGFYIRTDNRRLVLCGHTPRAVLYAVYSFLEDYLGCRWFTSEVSHIPVREVINLPAIARLENPALEYREPFMKEAFDGDWAARNKCNSQTATLTEKHGGKIVYDKFVHTFAYLVPLEKYWDTHPEYFSEVGGVRIKERTQLCLTNPDVLKITIEQVKEWLRANPAANVVSVSQNDWRNPCECEKCKAVDNEEHAHSGTLLRFVNAVAKAIEPEFPNVAIDTLAYQYTRPAPAVTKPRSNVIVRLCSIECCFTHALGTCDWFKEKTDSNNNNFLTDLKDWSKICDRLYIWDYVTNFHNYMLPHPNTDILADNVRFFINHNVKGVFEEGSYQSPGGYLAELHAYLLAKVLWNPDYDEKKAIDEFMTGVYKGSSAMMKKIIAAYRGGILNADTHLSFSDKTEKILRDKKLVDEISLMFDQAEIMADDADVLRRVKKARLWQRYLELSFLREVSQERSDLYDEYAADCRDLGVTRLTEWEDFDKTIENFKNGALY